MKWLLIIAAVVVALVALVIVVGSLLPRDHVVARTARIPAPAAAVWGAITDVSAFPRWRKDVSRVEELPATPTGRSWREFSSSGAITMAIDAAEPPRRLVSRIADPHLPFGGWWEYVITPDGPDASIVAITEHGSVYNPVFRFVSKFVMGHTATIDAYLRALGTRFDATVTPTSVAASRS